MRGLGTRLSNFDNGIAEGTEEAPASWLDLGAEIAVWEHDQRP
jgi:hypothetical protein